MSSKKTSTTETARRRLLKAIAGTGGVIATGKILPDNWKRPMVDMALLPAHAQTSTCTEQCTLDISVQWDTEIDVDLLLDTPGGTRIDPKATTQSQCLQHDGDADGSGIGAPTVNESISTIGTGVNPGTYTMFLRNNDTGSTNFGYTITGCGNDIFVSPGAEFLSGSSTLEVTTFTVPGS